jgi:hypothetical protein
MPPRDFSPLTLHASPFGARALWGLVAKANPLGNLRPLSPARKLNEILNAAVPRSLAGRKKEEESAGEELSCAEEEQLGLF